MQSQSIDYVAITQDLADKQSLFLQRVLILVDGLENNADVIDQSAAEIRQASSTLFGDELKHQLITIFNRISESMDTTADAIIENTPSIYNIVQEIINAVIFLGDKLYFITNNIGIVHSLSESIANVKKGLIYFEVSQDTISHCLIKLHSIPQLNRSVEKMQAALSLFHAHIEQLHHSTSIAEFQLKQFTTDEHSFVC